MTFVVDASVCVSWFLPDEDERDAVAAFSRLEEEGAVSPSLWWFETRSVLIIAERRKRITRAQADRAIAGLELLPVALVDRTRADRVVDLARRHRLTFYDAAYLELAVAERLPLATLDRALQAAALAEGVDLVAA